MRIENLRKLSACHDLLKQGYTQRDIAEKLGITLVTANKWCQKIAEEIEEKKRKQEQAKKDADLAAKTRRIRKEELPAETKELETDIENLGRLAQLGFAACLKELRVRLPMMSNEEVINITTALWDRVSK